jgi:hypothetical protein
MDVWKAIKESNCGKAEKQSSRTVSRPVAMEIRPGELRIVNSFTDQTVLRRLRVHELGSYDWQPLNRD